MEGRGRRLIAHEVGRLRRGPGGAVRPAAEGRGRPGGSSACRVRAGTDPAR